VWQYANITGPTYHVYYYVTFSMSRFLVKSDLNATYTFKSTSAMQVKNQLKLNVIILKIQNTLLLLVTKDLNPLSRAPQHWPSC
jgi:hypothetical protein